MESQVEVIRGWIIEPRIARKYHHCVFRGLMIDPGEEYYSIIKGGGGLGWIKHPDRIHIHCLQSFLGLKLIRAG